MVDRAQAEIYEVTERRAGEDYVPLGDIMEGALDEIEAIGNRDGGMVGVPTGFADLDDADQRPAPRPDDHRGGAARDGQVDAWPWTCAERRRSSTADVGHLLSLEMSRNEITMRLLSAEARVPLQPHPQRPA